MRFFVLQNPPKKDNLNGTNFVPVDGSAVGNAPVCPQCGKYLGMLPLVPPVRIELETFGATFGDVVFGPAEELLLSERVSRLYGSSGLSGLTYVAPAEVVKVKSHRKLPLVTPSYFCYRVNRGRAIIDEAGSGLVRDQLSMCEECHIGGIIKRASRIVIVPNSWSGEGLFFARGLPGTILVSEDFADFIRTYKISNCTLTPAEEFSFDYYPRSK